MKLVKFRHSLFFTWTCLNAQRNLYSLHLCWNISLRCRFWDNGKYFFMMPIFIIKTNVFQHKRKIIHRFSIWSRCLDLCLSSPQWIGVGQRDCKTAQVLCAGSCCLPLQRKVTSGNSEFLNFHYSCEGISSLFLWELLDSWLQVSEILETAILVH